MGYKYLADKVLAYYKEHPDIFIGHGEIASATNLSPAQVSGTIVTLINKGVPIERKGRGMTIYHSRRLIETPSEVERITSHDLQFGSEVERTPTINERKRESRPLFEHLATTRSGTMLVQSEEGTVYRLTELE